MVRPGTEQRQPELSGPCWAAWCWGAVAAVAPHLLPSALLLCAPLSLRELPDTSTLKWLLPRVKAI